MTANRIVVMASGVGQSHCPLMPIGCGLRHCQFDLFQSGFTKFCPLDMIL